MAVNDQTTTLPVAFNFGAHSIRTIDQNGEVWFVASDVCAVLEVTNPRQAVSRLDDDERSMLNIGNTVTSNDGIQAGPGNPNVNIINESGLYSLVLSSRKEQAKTFKRWVTHDVLPAIRKTGRYEAPQAAKTNDVHFNPEDPAALRAIIKLVPRDFLPTVLDAVNARMPGQSQAGDLQDPGYYREARDELFAFADSLPAGTKWPMDEAKRQRIADGYLSDILSGRRWLMSFDYRGQMQTTPVDKGSSIVNCADPMDVATLINEFVPIELIPTVLEVANQRIMSTYNASMKRLKK